MNRRCPPYRLPQDTLFCPGCLRVMDKLLWDAAAADFQCHPVDPDPCFNRISHYSSSPESYKLLRAAYYGEPK